MPEKRDSKEGTLHNTARKVQVAGNVLNKMEVTHDWVASGDFLTDNSIGGKPEGLQGYFFRIDPFKSTQYVRNANEFNVKNVLFGVIYWAFLVVYTIISFANFFNRPWVETFGNTAMATTKPIQLVVKTSCTTPWGCYRDLEGANRTKEWWQNNAAATSDKVLWMQVREHYASLSPGGYCQEAAGGVNTSITAGRAVAEVPITLCFSKNSDDGVDVVVPFGADVDYTVAGAPSLNLVVETLDPEGMSVEVQMEASQVKTVYVGVDVVRKEGEEETQEVYNADLFYNAKKPWKTATLRIRLQNRAGLRVIERPGSWWDVLASIGGASGFLLAVLTAIRGLNWEACFGRGGKGKVEGP